MKHTQIIKLSTFLAFIVLSFMSFYACSAIDPDDLTPEQKARALKQKISKCQSSPSGTSPACLALSTYDISGIEDFKGMFRNLRWDVDISNWDTSEVTDMSYMFFNAREFNADISRWNTSKVRVMSNMFTQAYKFNADISRWDVSNVEDMNRMFLYAYDFNANISNWNTSKVADMGYMFWKAFKFNANISNWDTSNVKDMGYMFKEARAFNQDISGWKTDAVIVCIQFADRAGALKPPSFKCKSD